MTRIDSSTRSTNDVRDDDNKRTQAKERAQKFDYTLRMRQKDSEKMVVNQKFQHERSGEKLLEKRRTERALQQTHNRSDLTGEDATKTQRQKQKITQDRSVADETKTFFDRTTRVQGEFKRDQNKDVKKGVQRDKSVLETLGKAVFSKGELAKRIAADEDREREERDRINSKDDFFLGAVNHALAQAPAARSLEHENTYLSVSELQGLIDSIHLSIKSQHQKSFHIQPNQGTLDGARIVIEHENGKIKLAFNELTPAAHRLLNREKATLLDRLQEKDLTVEHFELNTQKYA